MTSLDDQFDVFSNTLRLLAEQVVGLSYFLRKIKKPEEGISNIEAAFNNVLSSLYGLMCALKNAGACSSLYEYEAISTLLCIRHVLQHQPGRVRNNLRDSWAKRVHPDAGLLRFPVLADRLPAQPFYIHIGWICDGIAASNNAKQRPSLAAFWNLEGIRAEAEKAGFSLQVSYVCAMSLVQEAARTVVSNYSAHLKAYGEDSEVYLQHFGDVAPVDPYRFAITAQN
ncbi:hypothetical protein QYG06_17670 [Xanthomonas euvesicatoria]|uniref:Uncharacterized protein n=3 Tax=Gammaproteobacteria TaxID=1236 RepID=A0AB73H564_9XANT|nr:MULTISPECIES: hypothetical protein [Xanthomonas]AOY69359.1 hypothetical protein BHE83_22520 [Xanthomonas euvesicatoria pv. vesicatoria str. 85-10]APO88683.1 hypothetical protein BJD11_00465 [Xanthomonas euvesicatoria]KLB38557.1 hypothetical protein XEUV206_19390 [Xanthomonas euvesicatoria]KLB46031.1 hypothetical protein XEUV259_12020 [Xanthomonas euvesicatoria]KLB63547.1 hypothetical protein XEUV315_20185 [Xanthomonas euvesicatoria]